MRNSTPDSGLSMAILRIAAVRTACGYPTRQGNCRDRRRNGNIAHEGERYDWNRSARAATALYVYRHGTADPDLWDGVGLAHADRYLSEHQHPRHQRRVQLHRFAGRLYGRPYRHVLR